MKKAEENHVFSYFCRFSIVVLEKSLENKDQQLAELNQKYARLADDFKYNMKLIGDRDKELATFDQRFKGSMICF